MADFIDPSVVQGVLVAVVTGAAGWIGSRKINTSKARQTDGESSRADFELLKQTWREENAKLRQEIVDSAAAAAKSTAALTARMSAVEALLVDEQSDSAALVEAIRLLLDWIARHYPGEEPPELPARARHRLQQ